MKTGPSYDLLNFIQKTVTELEVDRSAVGVGGGGRFGFPVQKQEVGSGDG